MPKFQFQDTQYYSGPVLSTPEQSGDAHCAFAILIQKNDLTTHKALLEKILSAIGKQIDDCCLYYCAAENRYDWNATTTNHSKILSFGIEPGQLNLHIDYAYYKPNYLENKIVLVSHTLAEVSESVEFKKLLWASLKKDFN